MRLSSSSFFHHIFLITFLALFLSGSALLGQSSEAYLSGGKGLFFKTGEPLELAHYLHFGEEGQAGFSLMNEAGVTLSTHSVYGKRGEWGVRIIPLGVLEPGTYILLEHDGSRRKTETVVIVEP